MRGYLALLADHRFAALSVGQMVSLLGDILFPLVVLFAALEGGSPAEVALLVGTTYAVRFTALAGVVLLAGGLLDRVDPARSAAAADALRVVAFVLLVATWDGGPGVVVLVVAAVVGACEAVSEPAILVIGPRVVERGGDRPDEDRGDAAIGLLEAMRNVMGVAGPPAAALLLVALGYRWGIVVCAAAFAVSAVATLWAGAAVHRRPVDVTAPAGPEGEQVPLARTALTGLGILWRRPWLRHIQVLAVAQVLFAVGPWMVALPVAVAGADADGVQDYSLVLAAFAGGTILGALLGGRLKVSRPGLIALPALATFGVAALATGAGTSTWLQIAAYAFAGAGTQVFDVLKLRGMRRAIPPEEHGRAFGADFFFSFAALPLGQLVGAAALGFASAELILVCAGAFVLATGLLPLLNSDVRTFGRGASVDNDDSAGPEEIMGDDSPKDDEATVSTT